MALRQEVPKLWRSVFYPPPNYPYFELPPQFDSSPILGGLNLLEAAWMADAAMLAYGRSGPEPISPDDVSKLLDRVGLRSELVGDWLAGAKGTQGYFASNEKFAILAFRGTEKDDWKDLAADLATWPVAEDDSTSHPGTPNKTMFHLLPAAAVFTPGRPAVHRGFQAALNQVWQDVENKLREYHARRPGNTIFFTGHSLGAALAILACARFGQAGTSLYTFGSPRVGNRAFVAKLRPINYFRIVDFNDIVTRVPPGLFWYEHGTAVLYRFDAQGVLEEREAAGEVSGPAADIQEIERDLKCLAELRFPIDLDTVPPDDIYDHSPGRYANRLWNALAR